MAEEGSAEDMKGGKNTTEAFNENQDAAKEEDLNRVEDEDEDEKQSLNVKDTVLPESENSIKVRTSYDDMQKLQESAEQFKNGEQDDVESGEEVRDLKMLSARVTMLESDIIIKLDGLGTELEKVAKRFDVLRSEFDYQLDYHVTKALATALSKQSDTEIRTTVDSIVQSHVDEGVIKAEEEIVQDQKESKDTQPEPDQTVNNLSVDDPIWLAILMFVWSMASIFISSILRDMDTER